MINNIFQLQNQRTAIAQEIPAQRGYLSTLNYRLNLLLTYRLVTNILTTSLKTERELPEAQAGLVLLRPVWCVESSYKPVVAQCRPQSVWGSPGSAVAVGGGFI